MGRPIDRVAMTRAVSAQSSTTIMAAVIVATISTVLPGFLVGALSVQVSDEFGVSEAQYGWGLSSFFLAATAGSILLGRTAQMFGPRRQVTAALVISAAASVLIATIVNSFVAFAVLLGVAGFANAGNQTAINLLLSKAALPRLGLGIALKQSGMPAAALLGGLAVPAIAVTVGWRWAYVACAAASLGSVLAIRRTIAPVGPVERRSTPRPNTPRSALIGAGVGFGCLAFAAGALTAWIVGSSVDAGIGEGRAGLLLSLGAGCGIAVRLRIGVRLDAMKRRPLVMAALMSVIGAGGIVVLAASSAGVVIVVATIVAFGTGWVWPVFTNFGVVRANRDAAASATGVTQTGVYIGVFAAPLISGVLISRYGYSAMWLVTAAVMVVGAAITASVAPRFDEQRGHDQLETVPS